MTTSHQGSSARGMSPEVVYFAQHWEIGLTCVFLFKKIVSERKQRAESVIKKKEKWFLNVIQVTPPVTQGAAGHMHLLPGQCWPSLFAMPTTWLAFL